MEAKDLVKMAALAGVAALALTHLLAQARAAGTEALVRGDPTRSLRALREGWHIKQLETDRPNIPALTEAATKPDDSWMPATIPAQVHDVLLACGKIPDPRVGKNAAESAWVGQKDWVYACTFASPAGHGPVFLRFGGLDTIAAAYLNGSEIGRFDSMYRRYAAGVRKLLRPPGEQNVLLIVFSSPLRYLQQVRKRFSAARGVSPNKYLRKCHSDFGSYLGARPHSMKVGVFRDVVLDVPDRAWLEDVCVRPVLLRDFSRANVQVLVAAAGEPAKIRWVLTDPSGKEAARGTARTAAGRFRIGLDNPKLWWPRTHGRPDRYRLKLDVVLDEKDLRARAGSAHPAVARNRQQECTSEPVLQKSAHRVSS